LCASHAIDTHAIDFNKLYIPAQKTGKDATSGV